MTCVYAYYWYKLRIWEKPIRQSRDSSATTVEWVDEEGENPKTPNKLWLFWQKVKVWGPIPFIVRKV
jgi:hypothetical protein